MAKNNFVFEESINELEDIVKKLEDSDISLQESIKLYEKGIKLSKKCNDLLEKAELKINIIKNENFTQSDIDANIIMENDDEF